MPRVHWSILFASVFVMAVLPLEAAGSVPSANSGVTRIRKPPLDLDDMY